MTQVKNNRQLIADEAARLLYEEGYRDYLVAKMKAAERLGCAHDKANQPTNREIHAAILLRRELHASEEEAKHLRELRQVALEAMEFLQGFSPLLAGAVVDGSAGIYSPVTLHLFASSPEEVMFFLQDHKLPFQTHERSYKVHGRQTYYPLLRFYADDFEVELVIFEEGSAAPTSHIDGKRMQRMTTKEVRALIA